MPLDFEFHTSGVFPGLKPINRGPDGAADLWDVMRAPREAFTATLERARCEPTISPTWAAALEAAGLSE